MNNLDLKIMYAVAFLVALWMSPLQAETSKATPVDQIRDAVNINEPNNEATVFIKNQWEDIKAFQRKNNHEAKQQLERNRQQIRDLPKNVGDSVKQTAMGIGEFVQAITGVKAK